MEEFDHLPERDTTPVKRDFQWAEHNFSQRRFKKLLGIRDPGKIISVYVDIYTNSVKITMSRKDNLIKKFSGKVLDWLAEWL